jgi:hypothetical protein
MTPYYNDCNFLYFNRALYHSEHRPKVPVTLPEYIGLQRAAVLRKWELVHVNPNQDKHASQFKWLAHGHSKLPKFIIYHDLSLLQKCANIVGSNMLNQVLPTNLCLMLSFHAYAVGTYRPI